MTLARTPKLWAQRAMPSPPLVVSVLLTPREYLGSVGGSRNTVIEHSISQYFDHNVQLPPSEPRIVAPVSGHRGGARSTGRERNWSYELTSATATGGLICQFVACYELCAIATQRSGRRSKWLQPQKCSALTRAAQSDQAWNESKWGKTGSEF